MRLSEQSAVIPTSTTTASPLPPSSSHFSRQLSEEDTPSRIFTPASEAQTGSPKKKSKLMVVEGRRAKRTADEEKENVSPKKSKTTAGERVSKHTRCLQATAQTTAFKLNQQLKSQKVLGVTANSFTTLAMISPLLTSVPSSSPDAVELIISSLDVSPTLPSPDATPTFPAAKFTFDLVVHPTLLPHLASFCDYPTLMALGQCSRAARAAATSTLFRHIGVLTRGESALLVTPSAPFRRLPIDPLNLVLPPIRVLDLLSTYPSHNLGRTLPLDIVERALEMLTVTEPLQLVRAERFKLHPLTRRAVLHVTPPNLEPGQANSREVVWYPRTYCLKTALRGLLESDVAYDDLTVVLEPPPYEWYHSDCSDVEALSYAAGWDLMDQLSEYLMRNGGRITIVGAKRYARAWDVREGAGEVEMTTYVRETMRREGCLGLGGGGEGEEEMSKRLSLAFSDLWVGKGGLEGVRRLERVGARPTTSW